MTATDLLTTLKAADLAASVVPTEVPVYAELTDQEALDALTRAAHAKKQLSIVEANLAGEVARRSARELGSQGLARRTGHGSTIELVKATSGLTGHEAATAVAIGRIANEASGLIEIATGEIKTPAEPWLSPAVTAFTAGELSVAALDAIRKGIGKPEQKVTVEALRSAVAELVELAQGTDPDRLFKLARAARNDLDVEGIIDRERALHEARSLTLRKHRDGGATLVWRVGTEDAAILESVHDRLTSPKRGGCRFVDEKLVAQASAIENDPRTTEQIASDGFLHLVMAGADADDSEMLKSGAPVITILTTKKSITAIETTAPGATPVGRATIEGQGDPISLLTVERLLCEAYIETTTFDAQGNTLDHGREQRLYDGRQRKALAAKWGGCADPNCWKPPAWCEAHHILQWKRDHGGTDINDGILLCRQHHLMYHNNKWEITREGTRYWLTPPAGVPVVGGSNPSRARERIELLPKSPEFIALMKQNAEGRG